MSIERASEDIEKQFRKSREKIYKMLWLVVLIEKFCFLAKIFNSKKVQVSFRNRNSKGFYLSW